MYLCQNKTTQTVLFVSHSIKTVFCHNLILSYNYHYIYIPLTLKPVVRNFTVHSYIILTSGRETCTYLDLKYKCFIGTQSLQTLLFHVIFWRLFLLTCCRQGLPEDNMVVMQMQFIEFLVSMVNNKIPRTICQTMQAFKQCDHYGSQM